MRLLILTVVALAALHISFLPTAAPAQDAPAQETPMEFNDNRGGFSDDPNDPENILLRIEQQPIQPGALIPVSPLGRLRDHTDAAKQRIYDLTHLKLGLTINHLFQGLSRALPDKDSSGMTTDMDFVGKWELIRRGTPYHGGILFGLEGRWDYNTTGPQTLGFESLASAGGTGNAFSRYVPAVILRNLYWQQGSREAGWVYRIGKITPDQIMGATSKYISPTTTFLPNVGTGAFAEALPDSGLGLLVGRFINDRVAIGGLISDSNADRFNWGSVGAGDYFKVIELAVKIAPRTPNAGYSKVDIWHNDGTKDGKPINASSGREGWGFFAKHEQELTDDGRAIGILRYGRSYNRSAIYSQQAAVHFLLKEPGIISRIDNDLIGVAFNWVKSSTIGARDEYNFETFYRFPVLPDVDMTLSYQSVFDPAFNTEFDQASAFSLRLQTKF